MINIAYYHKKFKCIKTDNLAVQGDFNSWQAQSLTLLFEKCDQSKQKEGSGVICKSDKVIKEWLQRKFIVTMTNSRRFRLEEFTEGKIVEEARTEWIPFNSQLREEIVYQIRLSSLELQDMIWQWGGWTKEEV